MIAFRPYSQCPPSLLPVGIPLDLPWTMTVIEESQVPDYRASGHIVMTDDAYSEYVANMSDAVTEWQAGILQTSVENVVIAAQDFGQQIMVEFSAENVLMGISTADTNTVLNKLAAVQSAIQTGSLHTVIQRLRDIDPLDYDSTYITYSRILAFINKIETYLGTVISTEI